MERPDEDGPGYDYVSPGLIEIELPEKQFPKATRRTHPRIVGDPHAWYHHMTSTVNGYLGRDESILLYNNARQFEGKLALEIGSANGWSAWHTLKAGLLLSMCDPGFTDYVTVEDVKKALSEFDGRYRLTSIGSPQGVIELARYNYPFSFVLIDGNHDLPYPLLDAAVVSYMCADDALVMLHDAWSPGVIDALRLFHALGWATGIYRTSNQFGAAWRGSVRPVKHVADPAMPSREIPKELLLS